MERKCQFFVMKLCYSKATFVHPHQRANLESFLDGHVRAFEYFGGVPRRLAYDNLKCAVIHVGKGNEKRDVENGCKRSERTYLSPPPRVDSLGQWASQLFDACQKDLGRPGPDVHGGKTVGELFAAEKPNLLPLQSERFAACGRRCTFVDSQALVRVDNVRHSVPVEWAYHACTIEIFVDRVQVVCLSTRLHGEVLHGRPVGEHVPRSPPGTGDFETGKGHPAVRSGHCG